MIMKDTYDLILENSEKFINYFLNDEDHAIKYFPKFNSINIIVGANNCGKSRFMRELMSLNSYVAINDLLLLRQLIDEYNYHVERFNTDKIQTFIDNHTNRVSGNSILDQKADKIQRNRLVKLKEDDFKSIISNINANKKKLDEIFGYSRMREDFLKNYSKIEETFTKEFKPKRYYIPTLRSAHSLFQITKSGSEKSIYEAGTNNYEKIEKDIFLHTYLKNYQIDKSVNVFTGLHLYREILNSRNSEKLIRNQFEKFEKFLSINFFDGKQIDIVAKFDKGDNEKGINESELILIHVDGEKDTRKLYDLGDGIQALIVLMYKIFLAESNSFIFIDEPELNLHPGMQRLFLEQISSNPDLQKKGLKYIISTHSNHFLDLTIEKDNVSIYLFSPKSNELNEKQFLIRNVNRGDNKILKDLGVNNSSVFMANCSIWVEGISDRNYIKAFLKSYGDYLLKNDKKKYVNIKEDIDFAFFEYAGSNIDHYFFDNEMEKEEVELILQDIKALSLSNRIFLLADSDNEIIKKSSAKKRRLQALENSKAENFYPKIIWDMREIENMLTNDIWKAILINFCNETLLKDNKAEIQTKIETALQKHNYSKFKKHYIGEFLNVLREEMGRINNTYILNKSFYETKKYKVFGTIINKRYLSERVFEQNFSWEILSKNKEIEKLTIEIYNFITQK